MIGITKKRKTLIPINIDIFKKYISDRANDNDINRSFKKFKNFILSEEKDYETLNNAFSEYGSNNNINQNETKNRRNKGNAKRLSLNFSMYKVKNPDISDKSTKNIFKDIKIKNNKFNIKTISKRNNVNNIFTNFNKTLNNKFDKKKEIKKELLIYKKRINTISSKILKSNNNKINIEINDFIKKRNKITDKTNLNLNKTDGLFNAFKKSRKRINFIEFYNLNKKDLEEESNVINIISYKTMNNIYQKNMNQNKLFYDIKIIKDINNNFKNKIEKTESKLVIKAKKFNKKYKKNKFKFFGNEELKLLKNKKKNKEKKIISQKEIYLPQKIFGNNSKKERTISEEINLRKKKEKKFYDLIDNIMLNNDLFVYDINKIDKRLRLKKEINKS